MEQQRHQEENANRRVAFSEVSKVYVYYQGRPLEGERLFYNKRDYDLFQRNAAVAALAIRRRVEEKLDEDTFTLQEPESWLPSLQLLQDEAGNDASSIAPEEMIGIEHVIISRRVIQLLAALKRNHGMAILMSFQPERFDAIASHVSTVMGYIAYCKAKNLAEDHSD